MKRVELLLLRRGVIGYEELRRMREESAERGVSMIETLAGANVEEATLLGALSEVSGLEVATEQDLAVDPGVTRIVPEDLAWRLPLAALRMEQGTLVVATADPYDLSAADELSSALGIPVRRMLVSPATLRRMRPAAASTDSVDSLLDDLQDANILEDAAGGEDDLSAAVDPNSRPVVRLLGHVLADAISASASDIHIEREEKSTRIRVRVHGELQHLLEVPGAIHTSLTARLKVLCKLDLSDTRSPQDGRTAVVHDGNRYDLRVSTMPTYYGEKSVIRVLDSDPARFDLDASGIPRDELEDWRTLLHSPGGLLLVTGPTGSGKTTTLYSSLLELRDPRRNLVALENPTEYRFEGINHVQTSRNLDFARALRGLLRQDPDVVLVGEIRDDETAHVAVEAAQTGHLVLSTLHTRDAIGAIPRLVDLGLSPRAVAGALVGIAAQRLARVLCPACKRPVSDPDAELARLGRHALQVPAECLLDAPGCRLCHSTGCSGRTALFELARMSKGLRRLLTSNADEDEMYEQALEDGMRPLTASGLEHVRRGECSVESILQIIGPDLGLR